MATASHSVAPTAPWLRTQTLRPKRFRAKVDILPELRQLAVVRLDGLLRLIRRKYELSDPECQDALTALRPAVTAGPRRQRSFLIKPTFGAAVGMNESESEAGSNGLLSWLGCDLYWHESLLARRELTHPTG